MACYNILQNAGFIRADGNLTDGLVRVKETIDNTLAVDEQAILYEAKFFKHIDYVFFRRFSDARSSQVAAYVVNNTEGKLDDNTLSELHHQVWLQGTTPLLYIAGASQIDILSCAREPDFWDNNKKRYYYNPAKTFDVDLLGRISDEMKKFSALRLADGTFWDDPGNKTLAKHDKAAHQSLIQAVVDTDKKIDGDKNPLSRRLLLLFVLIKYLEDRGVFEDENIFDQFHKGAKCFLDVLQGNDPDEVNLLLQFMAQKFNGDVFDIKKFNEGKLTKKILKDFTSFIEAKTINNQRYLWEQFSFKHLPVEIISHLYQRFVKGGHGTVYTPPFLASLLLDYIMPYNKITGEERILDPACGSGVFLVGAFKRLIYLLRSKNNWKNPTVNKLKGTLKKCIFGVDLDQNAIDLTAFSLSLAICDALKPKVIWDELKFDYLRDSNLFEKDFFELLIDSKKGCSNVLEKKFDIVIGNPPFESQLTDAAKKIDKITQDSEPSRGKCPDNQAAYLFLEQASTVLISQRGRICMIQPSSFLYNRKPHQFRTNLFNKRCIETILDFTSIRRMYEANKQTIAVSAHAAEPKNNNQISHLTFRRTVSVNERICFEIDHYDHQYVSQKQAKTDFYIWRLNLLGGGRLIDISQRFHGVRTLAKYIKDKGWKYSEGFTLGKQDNPAPFLYNKNYLPSEALTAKGIDKDKIVVLKESKFERPRAEENYIPPLVLFRKIDSLPIAFWDKDFLSYSHEIVGIHASASQSDQLQKICKLISQNKDFFRFMAMLHGSCAFTERETAILKRDIDLLPYPEDKNAISFSFWEKVLCEDVTNYMEDYIRQGQDSKLSMEPVSKETLDLYSKLFVKMLGSVYSNLKASNPIIFNNLICQPFYFGEKPELDWLDENAEEGLEKLVYSNDEYKRLRTIRVVRYYDKNVFLIVKPDRLRYWLRSTAIRDADETLSDLYKQGY
ncbi:MAG: N-6 DNA methylase [Sedimentisphaerales bacterium]|nr:N-6 DNA methylase [Sedimentisphaerales bacterium]